MKYILSCFIIALTVTSCSEKETTPPELTKTELITASAWKYESGGVDGDRNGTVDVTIESTPYGQACILDNTIVFNAGGSGTADEGPSMCNSAAPQSIPITWAFINNESGLFLGGNGVFGLGGQFKIATLSATKLTLTKDTTFMSVPVSLILNLKH